MNDSLDLRNRILKMRENNNLIITKKDSLNNNLMSKFENSIRDDDKKNLNNGKDIINEKNEETELKSFKNNSENLTQYKDKLEDKNLKNNINYNEAQFLMLANKFNEAVEVILELSQKVEKLERNATNNSYKQKTKSYSSFFNLKLYIFVLLIPIVVLVFFTFPFDFSLIKLIVVDIFSNL